MGSKWHNLKANSLASVICPWELKFNHDLWINEHIKISKVPNTEIIERRKRLYWSSPGLS